jgi:hypothetical protein
VTGTAADTDPVPKDVRPAPAAAEGSAPHASRPDEPSGVHAVAAPRAPVEPIALDGLVYGIDLLDALLVVHLGDAHVYALWVRGDTGLRADDLCTPLRDAYRVAQFASRRLSGGVAPDRRADAPAPIVTVELPQRVAILRRIRAYVVAAVFDAAMPLGMARLVASRLGAALEPELPLAAPAPHETGAAYRPLQPTLTEGFAVPKLGGQTKPIPVGVSVAEPALVPVPVLRASSESERPPTTLSFGSGLPRRSHPPPPPVELDRTSRLLAYLEAHAPEPHVVRHRVALRAGLTLSALERPESLGPEAVVLVETAVQDILGIDRAELRRIA